MNRRVDGSSQQVQSSVFSQDLEACSGFQKAQECHQLNHLSGMPSWGRCPVLRALLWRHLPSTHLQHVLRPSPTLGTADKPFKPPELQLLLSLVT